jgi:CheY-like chemotaxis protein
MRLIMTGTCVLLIDDDPADVFLVQRAFAKLGLGSDLRVVNDGEEAIQYLNGASQYGDRERFPLPSFILLDLKMPRRSGFEVLEWLRGQPSLRRLPVIVWTSSSQMSDINKAYDVGANSYLVKTANPEAMQELTRLINLYWTRLNQPPQVLHESSGDE